MARVDHTAWPKFPHARMAHTTQFGQARMSHTAYLAITRPCLAHSLAFVDHMAVSSHTTYHTSDHTLVWCRQLQFQRTHLVQLWCEINPEAFDT
ncbi:hypothetical protein PVK06_048859 [Gossypium arboreum]|uniref:Uncharacterized protein n=1 Tax=Gossypium arboreum TaxID=29729 RepID=A0ABR0MH72_GOSAR|nr:hypothetical protein PVK06_048859 [Gossypium arboreum]